MLLVIKDFETSLGLQVALGSNIAMPGVGTKLGTLILSEPARERLGSPNYRT